MVRSPRFLPSPIIVPGRQPWSPKGAQTYEPRVSIRQGVRRDSILSMDEAFVRSLANDLAMKADLVARVISADVATIVAAASVMCPVVELAEMSGDEVVNTCPAALIEVRQRGQQAIGVVGFHAAGLGFEAHFL